LNADRASCRRFEAANNLDQRALAAATRAEQT
jgi:hypothetical protein